MTMKDDFKQDDEVLKHTGWDHLYVAKAEEAKVSFWRWRRGMKNIISSNGMVLSIFLPCHLKSTQLPAMNLRSSPSPLTRAKPSRENLVSWCIFLQELVNKLVVTVAWPDAAPAKTALSWTLLIRDPCQERDTWPWHQTFPWPRSFLWICHHQMSTEFSLRNKDPSWQVWAMLKLVSASIAIFCDVAVLEQDWYVTMSALVGTLYYEKRFEMLQRIGNSRRQWFHSWLLLNFFLNNTCRSGKRLKAADWLSLPPTEPLFKKF